MPQQIQPYGSNPYAEEALRVAEIGRGQEGMSRTAAPIGPNLQDGGGMSKPSVNTQPYNNARLMQQNMEQNVSSAVPLQQANALGQVRKGQAEMSDAEYKANEFKNERVAQMLYANDGGNKTFQMGIPEVGNAIQQHVAEQKLMANGVNPQIPFTSNRFAA
jgi:hypothetical protein